MQRLATNAAHAEKTMASLREDLARLKASAHTQTQDNHIQENHTDPAADTAVDTAAAAAVATTKPGALTVVSTVDEETMLKTVEHTLTHPYSPPTHPLFPHPF